MIRASVMLIAVFGLGLGACASQEAERRPDEETAGPRSEAGLETETGGRTAGEAEETTPTTRMGGMAGDTQGRADGCPMALEDTEVRAEDTVDGAALVFTNEGRAQDVRDHVQAMSDMHERMHARATSGEPMQRPRHGMREGGMGRGMPEHGAMMAARTTVEDVEGGARLVFTPDDEANLEDLRSQVREQAQRMGESRRCMMMEMMEGSEQPDMEGGEMEHEGHHDM